MPPRRICLLSFILLWGVGCGSSPAPDAVPIPERNQTVESQPTAEQAAPVSVTLYLPGMNRSLKIL